MRGLSYATEPWSEIVPNLFQGGHDYDPVQKFSSYPQDVIVGDEFDLVISLYRRDDGHGPAEGVEHEVLEILDGPLAQVQGVERLADKAHAAVVDGRKVLVRCQAGYNRSGLVVALVLMRMGFTAADAIALVQAKRSRHALYNEHFVRYLKERQS